MNAHLATAPRTAAQQPHWPDPHALRAVTAHLATTPPLVLPEESDRLREHLAAVARGEAFLLQGGDCAERLDQITADDIAAKITTLRQMSVVLGYATGLPVVPVGRIAGQYAKPRSQDTETRDGTTLPVYRGDAVNATGFTAHERTPDPGRLLRAHQGAAATLDLLRSLASGTGSGPRRLHDRNRAHLAPRTAHPRHQHLAREIERALRFMATTPGGPHASRAEEFFTSHEGLLLDYERSLVRTDPRTGKSYAGSGHLLWIGERTRRLDGAHVEFFARIQNPVAVKLGPGADCDTVLRLTERLNPENEPGRLTLITRMGAGRVRDVLPDLVARTSAEGVGVGWICDPMHGNTFTAPDGHKTRHLDDIVDEVRGFYEVHRALGTHPGGIHLELTGTDVTECIGGGVRAADLGSRYESACDPRLNHDQALEAAFRIAEFAGTPHAVADRAPTP